MTRVRRACPGAMVPGLLAGLLAAGVAPVPAQEPQGASGGASSVRLVVVSDLNQSYGTIEVADRVKVALQRIIDLDPDAVIVTGDMIAAQRTSPKLAEEELVAMWEAFHAAFTRPLAGAGIPLLVSPGNHDGSGEPAFANERREYGRQWLAHRPDLPFVDDTGYPFDYAVRVGPLLVTSLESTRIAGPTREQLGWLRSLLASEGPEPTIEIVFGHLPLFPFARGREREILRGEGLEALLVAENVEFHLTGHHHAFWVGERDGVTYVSQAGLGSGPRALVGTDDSSPHGFTVLDIAADGTWTVRLLTAPDYLTPVDPSTLPEAIETGDGLMRRSAHVTGRAGTGI